MKWFRNLEFRLKLAVPILILALLLAVTATVGIMNICAIGEHSHKMTGKIVPALNSLLQADRDLYQAQVAERSIIFVAVGSDEYLALI